MREKVWKFGAATGVAIVLLLCFAWFLPAQVTQISGLAVAQSNSKWNRLKDMAQGDSQTSGVGLYSPCLFNGTSCDRQRGSIATGAEVNVRAFTGNVTPADTFTNPTNAISTYGLTGLFNGTTWDRWRDGPGQPADGNTGIGIGLVSMYAFDGRLNDYRRIQAENDGFRTLTFGPVQSTVNKVTSQTASAANTAVVVTITGGASTYAHLYEVTARCSAGTSGLTVATSTGPTTVWSTGAAEVTTSNYRQQFSTALVSPNPADNLTVTLAACGAGNIGTLMVRGGGHSSA